MYLRSAALRAAALSLVPEDFDSGENRQAPVPNTSTQEIFAWLRRLLRTKGSISAWAPTPAPIKYIGGSSSDSASLGTMHKNMNWQDLASSEWGGVGHKEPLTL